MVSQADLSMMTSAQAGFMPDLCDVLALPGTPVSDGMGGFLTDDSAFITGASAIPCRLSHQSGDGRELIQALGASTIVHTYITVPLGTVVFVRDRIKVTSKGNRIFDVIANTPESYQTAIRIRCVEVGAS